MTREWQSRSFKRIAIIVLMVFPGLCCDRPVTIHDELRDPRPISRISNEGVVLDNGQIIHSNTIGEFLMLCPKAAEKGIEVAADGLEFYCVVPVQRMCGNDPVAAQDEAIPMRQLLAFLEPYSRVENGVGNCLVGGQLRTDLFLAFLRESGIRWNGHSSVLFPGEPR